MDTGLPDPNIQPYETTRNIGEHLLALPSYILHWSTRPIGYGIQVAENRFPHFFEGDRGPYGIFPLFETGGEQGFAGGVLLFHDNLIFPGHHARAELLFGSKDFNQVKVRYRVPIKEELNSNLEFYARYENNPYRSYYNNDNAFRYASETTHLQIRYNRPLGDHVTLQLQSRFRDITIDNSTFEENTSELFPESLLGNQKLLSIGSEWTFNFKNGRKRTLSGSQFITGTRLSQSAETHQLSFFEYYGEIHYFMPLPILPDTRRIAVKMQVKKLENLASESIPFYELPSLGGIRNLRGFSSHRFRNTGTLLLTAEYRYPVWDFLDMTLFIDEGQPFNRYSDLQLSDFETSYGFGLHLLSAKGLAFRSEFAFSNEGSRWIISISPNF